MWNGIQPQPPVTRDWTDAQCKKKRRADQAAVRKAKLADRLDDNFMLVAGIAFYLHQLKPGQWVDAEPIEREHRTLSLKWNRHLCAARRILGVKFRREGFFGSYRLLPHVADRVRQVGISRQELNELLEILEFLQPFSFNSRALREFAEHVNILDLTKRFLKSHSERLDQATDHIDQSDLSPIPPLPASTQQPPFPQQNGTPIPSIAERFRPDYAQSHQPDTTPALSRNPKANLTTRLFS
jgi:hypothetical protein